MSEGALSGDSLLALLGGGVGSSSFSQEDEPYWLTRTGFFARRSSWAVRRSLIKLFSSCTTSKRSLRGRGLKHGLRMRRRLLSRFENSSFTRKTLLICLGLTLQARGRFQAFDFSVLVFAASSHRPFLTKSSSAYNNAATWVHEPARPAGQMQYAVRTSAEMSGCGGTVQHTRTL